MDFFALIINCNLSGRRYKVKNVGTFLKNCHHTPKKLLKVGVKVAVKFVLTLPNSAQIEH